MSSDEICNIKYSRCGKLSSKLLTSTFVFKEMITRFNDLKYQLLTSKFFKQYFFLIFMSSRKLTIMCSIHFHKPQPCKMLDVFKKSTDIKLEHIGKVLQFFKVFQ